MLWNQCTQHTENPRFLLEDDLDGYLVTHIPKSQGQHGGSWGCSGNISSSSSEEGLHVQESVKADIAKTHLKKDRKPFPWTNIIRSFQVPCRPQPFYFEQRPSALDDQNTKPKLSTSIRDSKYTKPELIKCVQVLVANFCFAKKNRMVERAGA